VTIKETPDLIDIDSDNTNGFGDPDRSLAEERIENDPTKPGKILAVNDNDDDGDGIPDFADGFDWDGITSEDDRAAFDDPNTPEHEPEEQFVPVILVLPEGVNPSVAKVKLTYSASDPANVGRTGEGTPEDPYVYTPAAGDLRLWTKDGSAARDKASLATGGDFVPSDVELSWSALPDGPRADTRRLWLEAIAPSTNLGDQQITVALDPDGPGPGGYVASDAVRVTSTRVNLIIDGLAECDEDTIGGIVAVNGDYDEGNVDPRGSAIPDSEPDTTAGHRIVPEDADLTSATLEFSGFQGLPGTWKLTFPDKVRVWHEKQSGLFVQLTSDVESTQTLLPASPIQLWIEAVGYSESPRDIELHAQVTLAGTANGADDLAKLTTPAIEFVTWDRQTGQVHDADDVIHAADPRPQVSLEITDAFVDENGYLSVSVSGTVYDWLSELAQSPIDRLQSLTFTADGEQIDAIDDLPSLSSGSGMMPWQPFGLSVDYNRTFVLAPPSDPDETHGPDNPRTWGGRVVEIRAVTSPNGAGHTAYARAGIVIGWREVPQASPYVGKTHPNYPGSIVLGAERETYGGTVFAPEVQYIGETTASSPAGFEPTLARVTGLDDQLAQRITLQQNETDQLLAPFAFSPTKHYIVHQDTTGRPRIYVVTVNSLPGTLAQVTPNDLPVGQPGQKLSFNLKDKTGRPIAAVDALVFDGQLGLPAGSGPILPSGPVTEDILYTWFGLLYGDEGLRVLKYFQNSGSRIELGDVWGDLDLDYFAWNDHRLVIQVEEDVTPIEAAQLLYMGLKRALGYPIVIEQIPQGDLNALIQAYQAAWQRSLAAGATCIELYLSAFTIVNEGFDWVMTTYEVSQGHYAAAIGFLPFISGSAVTLGAKRVVINIGEANIEFATPVVQAINRASKVDGLVARFDSLLRDGVRLTRQQAEALVKGGVPTSSARPACPETRYVTRADWVHAPAGASRFVLGASRRVRNAWPGCQSTLLPSHRYRRSCGTRSMGGRERPSHARRSVRRPPELVGAFL
jgi:hypothetical protein